MDIRLAGWKNDKRENDRHPILKGGKPQAIGQEQYWVSMWINSGDDPELAAAVERMIEKLAEVNGTRPIISISLQPAEARPSNNETFDDIPF